MSLWVTTVLQHLTEAQGLLVNGGSPLSALSLGQHPHVCIHSAHSHPGAPAPAVPPLLLPLNPTHPPSPTQKMQLVPLVKYLLGFRPCPVKWELLLCSLYR